MIELYGMGSPNVLKVVLMLEELQLAYRFKHVHVWKGEQFTDTFKALNPNSKVPVLIDPDGPSGEPYRVFESGAILQYLAEKTGKFLPASGTARYDVMQWLMIQLTGVGPMFGQYVHLRASSLKSPTTRARAIPLRRCAWLSLSTSVWLPTLIWAAIPIRLPISRRIPGWPFSSSLAYPMSVIPI